MSGMVRTHNAKQVLVTFAGIPMDERGEDEFLRIRRNRVAFELTMGVDGNGVREQQNDDSAQIEIILLATSPTNALLTALYVADKASKNGSGVGPFSCRDRNSDLEIHFAEQAWIRAEPEVTYARGVGERVWVLETDAMRSFHGGH